MVSGLRGVWLLTIGQREVLMRLPQCGGKIVKRRGIFWLSGFHQAALPGIGNGGRVRRSTVVKLGRLGYISLTMSPDIIYELTLRGFWALIELGALKPSRKVKTR